jgi:8-oxo-dGTP pyrophosphatase MutT (NUDIX family)
MPDVADVPAGLRERARAYLASRAAGADAEIATPRHAATVVLLRDSAGGLEVYLLRRVGTMAFAAGMHVFPGGAVDPRDGEIETAWAGPPAGRWAEWLVCDEKLARALVCAAVRETFEESGVLLAGPDAQTVVADTTPDDIEADRLALIEHRLSIAEMLAQRNLVLRSDLLRPWAHWITPEFEPRRFDTRFFVAAVPPGQRPRDVSGEADATGWLSVRTAVDRHEGGDLAMLPPTISSLRQISRFRTVAEVLAAPRELRPVTPRLMSEGERLWLEVEDPE